MARRDDASRRDGFSALRLAQPVAAAGAVGLAAAEGAAFPITTGGTDITFGGVEWSSAGEGFTLDSPLTALPGATGESAYALACDATLVGGQSDAFDEFGGITVNGVAFNPPTGMVDFTTTADGGFISTIVPADIGGIQTSLDFFYDDSSPTGRVFGTFQNTTGSLMNVDVAYGGDLGSDSDTVIELTSTSDAIFDQALDSWVITSDGDVPPGDPVLTLVRFGEGGQVPSSTPEVPGSTAGPTGEEDTYADIWTLELAPGETQSLMLFVQLNPTVAAAEAGTSDFDSLATLQAAGLTAGLSNGQLAQTVNWVPEPGALAYLLGAVVVGAVWRKLVG